MRLAPPPRPLALALLLVFAASACNKLRTGPSYTEPAYIYFENASADQADVYGVVGGREPVRIGTVFSSRTDTLLVPSSLLGAGQTINIIAHILARSNVPQSGAISIRPGDRVRARLDASERVISVLPGD